MKSLNWGLIWSYLHLVRICLVSALRIDWGDGTDSKRTVRESYWEEAVYARTGQEKQYGCKEVVQPRRLV